jgi:hypothetical protein
MSTKGTPDNLKPSPMTYEVTRAADLTTRRIFLAQQAESMTREELEAAAMDAQVDTSGAASKEALVGAVQAQVRGTSKGE